MDILSTGYSSNLSNNNSLAKAGNDFIFDNDGNKYEVVEKGANSTLGKDEFLKILLNQMQYQDPLSPMENAEYVSQMTSFSMLEQLTQMSSKLDEVSKILIANSKPDEDEATILVDN